MKKIISFIVMFLFFIPNVFANDIKSITMDIKVDENGNAKVTETWIADLDSGTEGYKQMYDIGESIISNFQVSMNNQTFQTLNYWNVNASFNDKKYKCGINNTSEGVELCFGISDYGENTYVMNYDISNFVVSNSDKDMIYWTLIPYELSDKPEYFYIKVSSDFKYRDEDEVWAYGYENGYAYIYDGYIEMTSDNRLEDDEYVVLLAEFPLGTFNTSVKLDNSSDYYEDLASQGSYRDEDDEDYVFIIFIVAILISGFTGMALMFSKLSTIGRVKVHFPKEIKKLSKDILPFRQIPCNSDIYKAYYIAGSYKLFKNKTDFLGAILLKWLRDGVVEVVKFERNGIINKKEETGIKFNDISNYECRSLEKELYDFMYEASSDGVLEKYEFQNWCKENYESILSWFDDVFDNEAYALVNEGLINKVENNRNSKLIANNLLKIEAEHLKGLKMFFKEFTKIDDKEAIEVKVWKDYLIFAQILGMATEVSKQFKKLYPEVIPEDYVDDFIFIYSISNSGISSASAAKTRAESYDAGGGGSSFGGGGFGSFGGGGGGGFR